MPKSKILEARVLVAIDSLGVHCAHIVSGEEEHIQSLAAAGMVDGDPAAVAYMKSIGAEVIDVTGDALAQQAGSVAPSEDAAPVDESGTDAKA